MKYLFPQDLDFNQAAKAMGLKPKTLKEMLRDHQLPHVIHHGQKWIPKWVVYKWQEHHGTVRGPFQLIRATPAIDFETRRRAEEIATAIPSKPEPHPYFGNPSYSSDNEMRAPPGE